MTGETAVKLRHILRYLQTEGQWEYLSMRQILALTPTQIQEIALVALDHFTNTIPCPNHESQLPELWHEILQLT